ncbi:MAG TPA: pirin family protein [Thermoanaerobaculia bacterium]|nr:pirin family protein [Thermoanaerobaculia bacterium]
MLKIRKAEERGHFDHGWLNTYHTFSFADYYDAQFMGFRTLRVINEDRVQAGAGFGTHGHRDMEIVSYVLEGALAHHDSMGQGGVIHPGDVQRMSAGTGVLHSEMNASKDELVHFLQIWIMPDRSGITPGYEQKRFEPADAQGKLHPIGVTIHQDVRVYVSAVDGSPVKYEFALGRYGWLQVARGHVDLNGQHLVAGDGAAISDEKSVTFSGRGEVLLFDLN